MKCNALTQPLASLVATLAMLTTLSATAGVLPAYPLGTTTGTWQPDRFPPATFSNVGTVSGRSNALDIGVSSADSAANRESAFSSTFYNTQGRGYALTQGNYAVLYGSVLLPSAWSASTGATDSHRTDLWGVLSPATGGDTCAQSACNLFPILGFSNADPAYPTTTNPTAGRLRVFDDSVGYVDLGTTVSYGTWSDMCIAWTGTDIRFYVNGALVYTKTDLTQGDSSFGPPTQFTRMMIESYNFGSSYDGNWSGIGAGTVTSASLAGSGQTAAPTTSFPTALSVTVLDAGGSPLPCVPVTFAAPTSGASATLSATTVLTGLDGVASVTAAANATLGGPYDVTVALPGLATPPAPFALTNAPVGPSPPVGGGGIPVPVLPPALLALLGLVLFGVAALRLRP